jgi:hypothetical protein
MASVKLICEMPAHLLHDLRINILCAAAFAVAPA